MMEKVIITLKIKMLHKAKIDRTAEVQDSTDLIKIKHINCSIQSHAIDRS